MKDSLKKLICIVLMTAMVAEPMVYAPVSAYANSTSDKIKEAEKMQQDTKQQLGQTQNTLNQLKDSKRAIQNSLNNLNEQIDEKSEEMHFA